MLAEDKLFATLGTSVGKMWIAENMSDENHEITGKNGTEILVNDTIGFIRDLPPELIAAFTSTLEDSIESDMLLHVLDAGDSWIEEKIQIVETTLDAIGAKQKRLYVFNKSDRISDAQKNALIERFRELSPIFVSAVS